MERMNTLQQLIAGSIKGHQLKARDLGISATDT